MQQPVLSDEELIYQYVNGNERCLKMLIERYKSKIFTTIYYSVKDRCLAEDIFHDTFIKIITVLKKGQYRDEGKFLPWSLRIARNLIIDHYRTMSKLPIITDSAGKDLLSGLPVVEENREDEIMREQTQQSLRQLIARLPEEQREVLILRHYADLTFKEIAEITGTSVNTCLGRMRYALAHIRKLVAKHHISL